MGWKNSSDPFIKPAISRVVSTPLVIIWGYNSNKPIDCPPFLGWYNGTTPFIAGKNAHLIEIAVRYPVPGFCSPNTTARNATIKPSISAIMWFCLRGFFRGGTCWGPGMARHFRYHFSVRFHDPHRFCWFTITMIKAKGFCLAQWYYTSHTWIQIIFWSVPFPKPKQWWGVSKNRPSLGGPRWTLTTNPFQVTLSTWPSAPSWAQHLGSQVFYHT